MTCSRMCPVLAVATVLLFASNAWAQGSRNVNSSFGGRTLGGGVGGASRTAFGGTPGSRVEQAQSGAGEVAGNERFVRGNRDATQFVGSDTRDVSSTIFGNMSGGQNAGVGGLEGLNNLINRDRGGNQNRGGGNRSDRGRANYSIGMQIGFDYPAPGGDALSNRMEQRLAKMSQIRSLEPLKIDLEKRTATIRGVVATVHGRELAARMVLLEPGISEVRNLVTVWEPTQSSSSDTESGATPRPGQPGSPPQGPSSPPAAPPTAAPPTG